MRSMPPLFFRFCFVAFLWVFNTRKQKWKEALGSTYFIGFLVHVVREFPCFVGNVHAPKTTTKAAQPENPKSGVRNPGPPENKVLSPKALTQGSAFPPPPPRERSCSARKALLRGSEPHAPKPPFGKKQTTRLMIICPSLPPPLFICFSCGVSLGFPYSGKEKSKEAH